MDTKSTKRFSNAKVTRKNDLLREIKEWESMIRMEERAIVNLRHANTEEDIETAQEFTDAQIRKRKARIAEINTKCEGLQGILEKLYSGELDDEIQEDLETSRVASAILRQKECQKLQHKRDALRKQQEALAKQRSKDISARRSFYRSEGEMNSYQKHFDRTTPPPHIRKNLRNFPNNKGYIWKGIYWFGQKPCEKNAPTVVFEPGREYLTIHEWGETYRVFHKVGKSGKAKLVKEERRLPGIVQAFQNSRGLM